MNKPSKNKYPVRGTQTGRISSILNIQKGTNKSEFIPGKKHTLIQADFGTVGGQFLYRKLKSHENL